MSPKAKKKTTKKKVKKTAKRKVVTKGKTAKKKAVAKPKVAKPPKKRRKRKPRPKSTGTRRSGKMFPAVEHTVHTPPTGEYNRKRIELRNSYVTDQEKRRLTWWQQTYYPEIPIQSIYAWNQAEGWGELRRQFWKQFDARLLQKMAGDMAQSRHAEMQELEDARARALAHVLPPRSAKGEKKAVELQPKDFGQAVTAFVKLDERLEGKREVTLGAMTQTGGTPGGDGVTKDDTPDEMVEDTYSPAELRAMAQARLTIQNPDLDSGGE